MKKIILILLILLYIPVFSQTGGRKSEKTKIAGRRKSVKKSKPTWTYRETESGPVQDREMPKLFKRKRTKGREENSKILERQNKLRSKRRIRGNDVFHKRKYF